MAVYYQTVYNPRTGEVLPVDISGGTSELLKLYQQGWKPYSPTQEQTAAIVQQGQQIQAAQQASIKPVQVQQQLGALQPFVQDGKVDLIQVVKSGNQDAIQKAEQLFSYDDMKEARHLAKTPVTSDVYLKLGEGTKKNVRIVTPVELDEYNKMSEKEKAEHYVELGGVSAQVYAKAGQTLRERGLYPQLTWYEQLTSVKEEEGEQVTAKSFALQVGDAVVPFMYTVRNWDKMPTWEKGVQLFADTVFLLTYAASAKPIAKNLKLKFMPDKSVITRPAEPTSLGYPRMMSPTKQAKAEYKALQDMAKDAGAARQDLRLKIQARQTAEQLGIMPKDMPIAKTAAQRAIMDNAERAATRSMQADLKFTQSFTQAGRLTTKQIAVLEKASGIKGLGKTVTDIGRTESDLAKAWKAFENTKIPKGAPAWWGHLEDIGRIQDKLEGLYAKYEEIIRPQRVYGTQTEAAKGAGSWIKRGWGKLKGTDVYVDVSNEEQVGKYLYELKKLARRGVLSEADQKELYSEIATVEKRLKDYKALQAEIKEKGISRDIDDFFSGLGKPEDYKPSDLPVDIQLKMKLEGADSTKEKMKEFLKQELDKAVKTSKGKTEERFWEQGRVATKEKTQAAKDLEKLWEIKRKEIANAAERQEKPKAPHIEEEPKFGMKPKEKIKAPKYAPMVRDYGVKVLDDAIGIPLEDLDSRNKPMIKTAIQINQEYERQLAGATSAAISALLKTYTRTMDMEQAKTDAATATEHYLDMQPDPKVQPKEQVKVAIQTAVKDAVKDIIKYPTRPKTPKIVPPASSETSQLEIEHVEGIPSNPGVLTWEKGVVGVKISPPYREGSEDIDFVRLKHPRRGKGTQESTLKVRGGRAPKLVVLGKQGGIAKTYIYEGKKMRHVRQPVLHSVGSGIVSNSGRVIKQKRGSVI